MRPAIFALILFASPPAFCQSAPPAPVKPALPPLTLTLPPQPPIFEFNQPPNEFHFDGFVPRPTVVLHPAPLQFKDHAQIDPQMIVHPPKSSLGLESPGTLIAQNLYPGLQLLPIDQPKAKLEPIPTTWPNLKVEPIPIYFPTAQITLIGTGESSDQKKKK